MTRAQYHRQYYLLVMRGDRVNAERLQRWFTKRYLQARP